MEIDVNTKKKITIVANFCDYGEERTNNRFNYLAQMLVDNGYDVELVTSTFSHREKKQRSVTVDNNGYKSTIIYEPSYHKNVSIKRFKSHYIWGRNVIKYLESAEKPDLIYCAVPSIDGPLAVSRYCKKNHIPFVIDVQDLWPEAFQMVLHIPIISSLIFLPFKWRVNKIYSSADAVVAVSETYARRALSVNEKDKSGCVVYLGTDLSRFDESCASAERISDGKLRLAYCGTLGSSYDLTSVFDAMAILKNDGIENLQFVVMGSGPLQEKFEQYAKEKELDVVFTGKLPYPEMCARLASCDIAVNCISKGAAQSIINKHGDYLASGLPIISTQECFEFRNLIDEYNCGINCDSESREQISEAIKELISCEKRLQLGKNARRVAEEKFDRGVTYPDIVNLIRKIEQEHRS